MGGLRPKEENRVGFFKGNSSVSVKIFISWSNPAIGIEIEWFRGVVVGGDAGWLGREEEGEKSSGDGGDVDCDEECGDWFSFSNRGRFPNVIETAVCGVVA